MNTRSWICMGLFSALLAPLGYAYANEGPILHDHGYGGTRNTTVESGPAPAAAVNAPPVVKRAPQGKTRAEVRQELIQAYRDGLIPMTEADYPPSRQTIERNKARFAASERYYK
ncbi:DUF4148 domain-containing protein [Paraburkholderia bengalensis]